MNNEGEPVEVQGMNFEDWQSALMIMKMIRNRLNQLSIQILKVSLSADYRKYDETRCACRGL